MNLFDGIDATSLTERFDMLLQRGGLRVERIVSTGQATPDGQWYDQPQDEWVIVIEGSASLLIEGEPEMELRRGDHVLLPARCRHRVTRTDPDQPTVWLAVHFG